MQTRAASTIRCGISSPGTRRSRWKGRSCAPRRGSSRCPRRTHGRSALRFTPMAPTASRYMSATESERQLHPIGSAYMRWLKCRMRRNLRGLYSTARTAMETPVKYMSMMLLFPPTGVTIQSPRCFRRPPMLDGTFHCRSRKTRQRSPPTGADGASSHRWMRTGGRARRSRTGRGISATIPSSTWAYGSTTRTGNGVRMQIRSESTIRPIRCRQARRSSGRWVLIRRRYRRPILRSAPS